MHVVVRDVLRQEPARPRPGLVSFSTQIQIFMMIDPDNILMWFHLFIDVGDAIFLSWKNEELKSIDSISIGGICYLKRVFALRKDFIQNQEGNWFINYDQLPKQISFSKNIPQTYFCVVCSEEETDEKDDTESLKSCQSDRTFSHSRFADNSWNNRVTAEIRERFQQFQNLAQKYACRVAWLCILHHNTVELNNNKHLLTLD
ncbi:DUF667 domain-containing protein [Trichonephila clavipes]|nr:DUF667 domain-containing protein [Trichonephila clavipes]